MKINHSQNINFGYNKKLNLELIQRLKRNQESPVNSFLLKINNSCNYTENIICSLEEDADSNSEVINILIDYLLSAKSYLCKIVDRLFPDLNFSKTECDTYDEQSIEKPIPEFAYSPNGVKREYYWREVMRDVLDNQIKDSEQTYNPEGEKYYENEENDLQTQINTKRKDERDPKGLINSNVEKFSAGKNSPKSLDDVIGLDKSRDDIRSFIINPIKNPEDAIQRKEDYGIEIPHFIVFHGPPGCGKTMLAEAIAIETGCEMYKIDLSQLGSSYVNGTVQAISKAFDTIFEEAKNSKKPIIAFMDEMDSLLSSRETGLSKSPEDNKVVNALLPIITSSVDKNVIIIGATNMYDSIDPAAKRRIEINTYIGLPNKKDIEKLLVKELTKFKKGINLAKNKIEIEHLSKELAGYTPANIVNMIKEASRQAYKESREIYSHDIINALKSGTYEKIKENEYMPENMTKKTIGFNF